MDKNRDKFLKLPLTSQQMLCFFRLKIQFFFHLFSVTRGQKTFRNFFSFFPRKQMCFVTKNAALRAPLAATSIHSERSSEPDECCSSRLLQSCTARRRPVKRLQGDTRTRTTHACMYAPHTHTHTHTHTHVHCHKDFVKVPRRL